MLQVRRGAMLVAGMLLLVVMGSACFGKSPTGDYCSDNPENCETSSPSLE